MNKERKDIDTTIEIGDFDNKDLTGEQALKIAQDLVKEFIDTKQRLLTDDRKLNAIGKALIEQKKDLEEIFNIQNSHGKELSESFYDISEKQTDIYGEVTEIGQSMKGLQETKNDQRKFIEELSHFEEKHNELVESSREQSGQSISRLESISERVTDLFEQIDNIDIEDRVIDISTKTEEINELLKSHSDKQEQARENASQGMLDLLAEVTSFKRQLSEEGLSGRLTEIQKVSDENKEKIDDLNEKFDIFVEVYELSRLDNTDSLEDIFSGEEDDLENIFSGNLEDNLEEDTDELEEEDLEGLEEDELEDGLEDELEDDLEDDLEVTEGLEEDDLEVTEKYVENEEVVEESEEEEESPEIPEYGRIEKKESLLDNKEEPKKEGFFNKLFGGR